MDSAWKYLQRWVDTDESKKQDRSASPSDDQPCSFDHCNGEQAIDNDNDTLDRMEGQPSTGDRNFKATSFSGLIKTKSLDMASRISLFQSPSIDVQKSDSTLSKTTTSSSSEQTDFSWANSLSSNRHSFDHHFDFPNNNKPKKRPRHVEWWSHGILWTSMAVVFGWTGVGCSYAARQNTQFVSLNQPMYLDPRYETIPSVGMIRIELCFNTTHLDLLEGGDEPARKQQSYGVETGVHVSPPPCLIHRMTSEDVQGDALYTTAQASAFLAMVFGGFGSLMLTFAIVWKSINLRPIGASYLLAYFLQSATFVVFDANICNEGCRMSRGGTLSVIASICWILSCAAAARMEHRKHKNECLQEEPEYLDYDDEHDEEHGEHDDNDSSYENDGYHDTERQEQLSVVQEHKTKEAPKRSRTTKKTKTTKKSPSGSSQKAILKPKAIKCHNRGSTAETARISVGDESSSSPATPKKSKTRSKTSKGQRQDTNQPEDPPGKSSTKETQKQRKSRKSKRVDRPMDTAPIQPIRTLDIPLSSNGRNQSDFDTPKKPDSKRRSSSSRPSRSRRASTRSDNGSTPDRIFDPSKHYEL